MRLMLKAPGDPHITVVETDHFVTIENPYVGPILTHDDLCVSLFARDNGFEGYIWKGSSEPDTPVPADAVSFVINNDLTIVVKE